jgi:hypothetical protein
MKWGGDSRRKYRTIKSIASDKLDLGWVHERLPQRYGPVAQTVLRRVFLGGKDNTHELPCLEGTSHRNGGGGHDASHWRVGRIH